MLREITKDSWNKDNNTQTYCEDGEEDIFMLIADSESKLTFDGSTTIKLTMLANYTAVVWTTYSKFSRLVTIVTGKNEMHFLWEWNTNCSEPSGDAWAIKTYSKSPLFCRKTFNSRQVKHCKIPQLYIFKMT